MAARHYVDDLLREMGARPVRRPLDRVAEWMMPVDPGLYADLKAELDRNRDRRLRESGGRTRVPEREEERQAVQGG